MPKPQKTYTLSTEQAEVLESLVEAGEFESVEQALDEAIDLLVMADEESLTELLPMLEAMAAEMRAKGESTSDIDKQIMDLKNAIESMKG